MSGPLSVLHYRYIRVIECAEAQFNRLDELPFHVSCELISFFRVLHSRSFDRRTVSSPLLITTIDHQGMIKYYGASAAI